MTQATPRFALSIRTKVLLLSPLLLAIPYVGYQYVREMEDFLRTGLQETVLATARALASSLHDQPSLFERAAGSAHDEGAAIYAHPIPSPIEVDGYKADWQNHLSELRPATKIPEAGSDEARFVAGKHGDYLYLLFVVDDDRIVYRQPQASSAYTSDHIRIDVRTRQGTRVGYVLRTISPGWVSAYEAPSRSQDQPTKIEVRLRAEWQPQDDGYVVEVRLPLSMLGPALAVSVVDVDDPTAAAPRRVNPRLRPLILPSAEIESLIKRLGRMEGRRVWVLDERRRVLARGGTLDRDAPVAPINPLYSLLLRPPSGELFEEHPVVSQLSGAEIDAALSGRADTRWKATSDKNLWIVSAAYPVWSDEQIVGVVVVEESSLAIQTVTREALANLFNKTLLVCLVGALALLLFASRIGVRLHRLRNEAEASIDSHGRVTGTLSDSHGGDEIGELSRSFSTMMERLRQYNHYLENLARRLSHELRTPIAVVRSSLESMQLVAPGESGEVYNARARDGLARLDAIITRMSEATRLEQAMEGAKKERFDLAPIISAMVDAYRATWPRRSFELEADAGPIEITGLPDLITQMLDKLVSNAIELGATDRPIVIRLKRAADHQSLSVTNFGSRLPDEMQAKLFDSMVSIRAGCKTSTPHLGLGLYIARLIAEFHNARISARNLADSPGVEVLVEFGIR